jgi:hypothetical protein
MDAAKSQSPEVTVKRLVEEDRALARDHRPCKAAESAKSATSKDVLAIGVTSIADIEKLMEELLAARDYLQSEGERVREVNARYAHSAKTASASAKVIAESLGKWRNPETISHALAEQARAPTLSPTHSGELQQAADYQDHDRFATDPQADS